MPTGKARKISCSAEVASGFLFCLCFGSYLFVCLFGVGVFLLLFWGFFETKTECFISNFGHFRENHS